MLVDGTLAFEAVNGGTRLRWDLGHGPGRTDAVVAVIGPGWEGRNWAGLMTYMESGPPLSRPPQAEGLYPHARRQHPQLPRTARSTVADQLADDCRTSADGGQRSDPPAEA